MVLLEDNVATESCPFCDTHLENEPESAAGMVMPESLLPFAVEEREARAAFAAWLGSLWFAPTELIHLASLGRMSGVYLPYWTYDAMTYTFYTGERGDNYQDTEWYTETKADGTTERKSRTVTRIRWRRVSGEVQHFFDDVLVCGSHSLPADLIRKLEPWDLDRLDGFLPDYLSGFKTERYMVDLTEGYEIAKEVMGSEIRTLVKADIGGDHQRVHSTDTRHSAVTFKHLLLPVWVAVYRYHDKTFQILVNGRTGEVAGYRPWSWMKVGRLAGIVFLFAATLFFLWLRFGQ